MFPIKTLFLIKNFNVLFLLSLLPILLATSCEEEDSLQLDVSQDSQLIESLQSVEKFEVSKEQDAIKFYVGLALSKLLNDNEAIKKKFLSKVRTEHSISLAEFASSNQEFSRDLNSNIKDLVKASYYNSAIGKINELSTTNDILKLFNNLISVSNNGEELVFYVPDNLRFDENIDKLGLGVDVTLPYKNKGLLLNGENYDFITYSEASIYEGNIVYIGINEPSLSFLNKESDDRREYRKKLSKWFHNGRVEWQNCTSQCDVDYRWDTCYRWYSSWRIKESGTLVSSGQFDDFSYDEYRIRLRITYYGLGNFSVYEKKWRNDSWKRLL